MSAVAVFSHQAECHTLIQLCRRNRPKEGSDKADEAAHEAPHAAVSQRKRLHQRYVQTRKHIIVVLPKLRLNSSGIAVKISQEKKHKQYFLRARK